MAVVYSAEQRAELIKQAQGKTIKELEWVEGNPSYWVMHFTDDSEVSIRFMAEIWPPASRFGD